MNNVEKRLRVFSDVKAVNYTKSEGGLEADIGRDMSLPAPVPCLTQLSAAGHHMLQ